MALVENARSTIRPTMLSRPFQHVGGQCWAAALPELAAEADDLEHPRRSRLLLFEGGRPLVRPHAEHAEIQARGEGRFSHWRETVYFSTTDGSNPNSNERCYSLAFLPESDDHLFEPATRDADRDRCRLVLDTVKACGQFGIVDTLDRLFGLVGRRVLEIGCGHCWYAPVFLERGAVSFSGTDPYKDFDIDLVYDYRGHQSGTWQSAYQQVPMTLREFLGCYRGVSLAHDPIEKVDTSDGRFDAAFMISVTEHLRQPRESFARIAELLEPGGYLYITHHNYYGWNGHHREPKFVDEIDLTSEAQQRVVDWNHLRRGLINFDEDAGNYLNFIRLHELTDVLREFFELEWWELRPAPEARGGARLTREIRQSLPQYYTEELTTEVAAYLCRRPK